ncbi:COMM domain-containing protein 1-like [Acanthaster planci]|uniref:COMM domain-containing protein 1 n=1 Tax=Acanthaster planci TaxID=133434 RepID=A0A8B7Y616_ACAPL|nr:COMM domain-containing protein 1-like [Acanthaster planci]
MASEERESRAVLGLLNGLAKREYFGKDEFSDEFLKAELMESASDEDFSALLSRCKSLLKNIVSGNMDVNQLDAFLTSQTKKKGGINSAQAAAFGKFWRNNKAKIHDSIVAKSMWGNSLRSMSWRIDIKSQSKCIDQINMPTAIVELQLAENNSDKEVELVRFEMDEEKLAKITKDLDIMEAQIAAHCH